MKHFQQEEEKKCTADQSFKEALWTAGNKKQRLIPLLGKHGNEFNWVAQLAKGTKRTEVLEALP